MRRRLCQLALILGLTTTMNAASVLAERTVEMLDSLNRGAPRGSQRHVVLVVHTNGTYSPQVMRHDRLEAIPETIRDAQDYDLYAEMTKAWRDRKFQCILLLNPELSWEHVILVEQFARSHKLAVISTSFDRGSVPFVIDAENNQGFYRYRALKSFGLPAPPVPPRVFDRMDDDPRFARWVRCTLVKPERRLQAEPEMICYVNAVDLAESSERGLWIRAIRDLSVALARDPVEREFKVQNERVWGVSEYFPHIRLAEYLDRLGNCAAVTRQLKASNLPDASARSRLVNCGPSVGTHRLGPGVPAEDSVLWVGSVRGDQSPIPSAPGLDWSALLTF